MISVRGLLWKSCVGCHNFFTLSRETPTLLRLKGLSLVGYGSFTTFYKAIKAALVLSISGFIIKIKHGTYEKNTVVPFNKTNLFLVWDGSGITIVTATKNTRDGLKTLETAKMRFCMSTYKL